MLERESLRANKLYWVQKRNSKDLPTVALLHGELPSLSIKTLDDEYLPCCSKYDFLSEAKYDELWNATFKGTTLDELRAAEAATA